MRTSELKGGGNVTISPFHVPAAAVRPVLLVFPTLCGCCAPECTDYVSLSLVTLTDAMRSLDVFLLRAYSVVLASRDLGYPRITCHRFAYSYVPRYLPYLFPVTFYDMPESWRLA